jgi:hypothetical protein
MEGMTVATSVSTLASGTQVRGFEPSQSHRIFGRKNHQRAFLRRGSKTVSPMSQLCGMLKNPTITVEVAIDANSISHFSPIVLPFSARGLSRYLCAERAGRRQVRPNLPIGCSAYSGETHRPCSKERKEEKE